MEGGSGGREAPDGGPGGRGGAAGTVKVAGVGLAGPVGGHSASRAPDASLATLVLSPAPHAHTSASTPHHAHMNHRNIMLISVKNFIL